MVVKIYAPAPSVSSGLNYNENKVAEGKASVIFSSKIDDLKNPMETFQCYENGSIRTEKMSFHASVNPSVTDGMTDDQVREFVKEWMEKMGYGNQPYILYKHTDIDRPHYHIVSVRVDENGRKIPDFKERKRSLAIMSELAPKYGFEVGKGQSAEESAGKVINPYEGFNPEAGNYARQIESIADLVMQYYFKQPREFEVIMEGLGIKVGYEKDGERESMYFIGLDPKTHKPCTAPIPSDGIRFPDVNAIEAHIAECKGLIKTREKERVRNIVNTALSKTTSEKHFRRYLSKCGIYVDLSKTADGKIFGATFVDHHNKCCFKASEVGIKAALIEKVHQEKWPDESKHAKHTKHHNHTAHDTAQEIAQSILGGFGNESSRRHEDEELMKEEGQLEPE